MDRTLLLRRITVAIVGLCALLAGWLYVTMPTTIRIAVGPADSRQHRYVQALARALRETRQPFRLRVAVVTDSTAAGRALDANSVGLAVLRSDDSASGEAQSLAVLQKRYIVVIARTESRIATLGDLQNRSVAIIGSGADINRITVEKMLRHYGVPIERLAAKQVPVAEVAQEARRHDAFVTIVDPVSDATRAVLDSIAGAERASLVVIGMPAPEGVALRFRELQTIEVPAGAFGGNPPLPNETLKTVGITLELVASASTSKADGKALLTSLLEARTRLRRLLPRSSFKMETPPVEDARRFLPHAGAVAYANDEEAGTFFVTYSDQIWLVLFLLSILGSSITGLLAWTGFFDAPIATQKLPARVAALAARLDDRIHPIDLNVAQTELDCIILAFLREYDRSSIESASEHSLALWTTSLSAMINRRRGALATTQSTIHSA